MGMSLQKAGIWKRFAAWLLDAILVCVLSVGVAFLLSLLLGFDGKVEKLTAEYERYEKEWGITFNISEEEYSKLTDEQKDNYAKASEALNNDTEVILLYNEVMNIALLIISISLLFSIMILEFLVPLLLKNGKTVGKLLFSICLCRPDHVKVSVFQLFVRALLGKYTLETMLPIYIAMLTLFGALGSIGSLVLIVFFGVQLVIFFATRNYTFIHDLIAATVCVDYSAQKIFDSPEALLEYQKAIHRESAQNSDY